MLAFAICWLGLVLQNSWPKLNWADEFCCGRLFERAFIGVRALLPTLMCAAMRGHCLRVIIIQASLCRSVHATAVCCVLSMQFTLNIIPNFISNSISFFMCWCVPSDDPLCLGSAGYLGLTTTNWRVLKREPSWLCRHWGTCLVLYSLHAV